MSIFSRLFRTHDALASATIQQVAISRSSGTLETGWHVDGVLNNTVWVSAEGIRKRVSMADVLKANPVLLIGRMLRIRRESGKYEAGWQAVSLRDDEQVKLQKPGCAEMVSLEEIVKWNDWDAELAHAA